ncbi:hypothetical protein KP509_14G014700 [Ceratopteris richardii]|uniref:Uncharacterized protein n=1 Tax=Ceratopteris richardii TaxID=49495 RepID=A0A8T2TAH0_CERRI|nr:hypothetical protein KP509_14G014700 [Ceratopteris richardii]
MHLHSAAGCHGQPCPQASTFHAAHGAWRPLVAGVDNGPVCKDERLPLRGGSPEPKSPSKLGRARPKNPRLHVEKQNLQEFTKGLEKKLQTYEEVSKPSLIFSAEERRALNKNRPNFDVLSSDKWPLFHTLAVSGDSLYVDRLLRQNIDVNALDKDGYSALQRAVLARKEAVVNQLLRAKADTSICDKAGATLLHFSVQTGSMNLVRVFLSCGVNVNSADKYGWTPLHLAVLIGRADIVRLLLASGADRTLQNKNGLTPLDLCFSLGRAFNSIEVAKVLKRFNIDRPSALGSLKPQ